MEDGTTIVKAEVPVPPDDTGTLLGLNETTGPKGNSECDRDTVFEKPLILPKVMVADPDELAGIVRELGLTLMLKSTTLMVITTERDKGPLMPTTVRV